MLWKDPYVSTEKSFAVALEETQDDKKHILETTSLRISERENQENTCVHMEVSTCPVGGYAEVLICFSKQHILLSNKILPELIRHHFNATAVKINIFSAGLNGINSN